MCTSDFPKKKRKVELDDFVGKKDKFSLPFSRYGIMENVVNRKLPKVKIVPEGKFSFISNICTKCCKQSQPCEQDKN